MVTTKVPGPKLSPQAKSPTGNTGYQYSLKSIFNLSIDRAHLHLFPPLQQKPCEAPGEDKRGDRGVYNSCPLGESDRTAQPAAPRSCCRRRHHH